MVSSGVTPRFGGPSSAFTRFVPGLHGAPKCRQDVQQVVCPQHMISATSAPLFKKPRL